MRCCTIVVRSTLFPEGNRIGSCDVNEAKYNKKTALHLIL